MSTSAESLFHLRNRTGLSLTHISSLPLNFPVPCTGTHGLYQNDLKVLRTTFSDSTRLRRKVCFKKTFTYSGLTSAKFPTSRIGTIAGSFIVILCTNLGTGFESELSLVFCDRIIVFIPTATTMNAQNVFILIFSVLLLTIFYSSFLCLCQ